MSLCEPARSGPVWGLAPTKIRVCSCCTGEVCALSWLASWLRHCLLNVSQDNLEGRKRDNEPKWARSSGFRSLIGIVLCVSNSLLTSSTWKRCFSLAPPLSLIELDKDLQLNVPTTRDSCAGTPVVGSSIQAGLWVYLKLSVCRHGKPSRCRFKLQANRAKPTRHERWRCACGGNVKETKRRANNAGLAHMACPGLLQVRNSCSNR